MDTLVTDDVLSNFAKSGVILPNTSFGNILHGNMSEKQIYNSYKQNQPASQGKKKTTLRKKSYI